jgi:hypothetical protein
MWWCEFGVFLEELVIDDVSGVIPVLDDILIFDFNLLRILSKACLWQEYGIS